MLRTSVARDVRTSASNCRATANASGLVVRRTPPKLSRSTFSPASGRGTCVADSSLPLAFVTAENTTTSRFAGSRDSASAAISGTELRRRQRSMSAKYYSDFCVSLVAAGLSQGAECPAISSSDTRTHHNSDSQTGVRRCPRRVRSSAATKIATAATFCAGSSTRRPAPRAPLHRPAATRRLVSLATACLRAPACCWVAAPLHGPFARIRREPHNAASAGPYRSVSGAFCRRAGRTPTAAFFASAHVPLRPWAAPRSTRAFRDIFSTGAYSLPLFKRPRALPR